MDDLLEDWEFKEMCEDFLEILHGISFEIEDRRHIACFILNGSEPKKPPVKEAKKDQ